MEKTKLTFNVSKITEFGNGGGKEVKMTIARDGEIDSDILLKIKNEVDFEFGKYEVTFEKISD